MPSAKKATKILPIPLIDQVHVEAADIVQPEGEVTALIPDPDTILSDLDQANLKKWAAIIAGVALLISQVAQLIS